VRRLYFFEVFALANLAIIAVLARGTLPIVGSPLGHTVSFAATFLGEALLGIAVRCLVAAVRRDRTYFRIIRSRRWILDTLRMVVSGGIVVTTYGWIKLVVPILHPRSFDQALWNLDRLLFFGMSPTTFVVELFDAGPFLFLVDQGYAYIFAGSAIVGFSYILSEPSRRVRIAFANGNAVLWLSGAWLYLLIPSVGPVYRFPEVWLAHAKSFELTQTIQRLLMTNYQHVVRAWERGMVTEPISIVFGIGAFPSLHVAFQTYVFLWMRRLWTAGEVLFGIFVFVIFLGSMITGWHYLVDGVAGMVMAYVCYRIFWKRGRLERFMELRKTVAGS
jgi:hypothetical protein